MHLQPNKAPAWGPSDGESSFADPQIGTLSVQVLLKDAFSSLNRVRSGVSGLKRRLCVPTEEVAVAVGKESDEPAFDLETVSPRGFAELLKIEIEHLEREIGAIVDGVG